MNKYIILLGLTCVIASCVSPKIKYSKALLNAKDSVLIENNTNYSKSSIVGTGATLAKNEKSKIQKEKINQRNSKLSSIEGLSISKYLDDNGIERTKITVQNDILFMTNSIEINEGSQRMLSKLYQVISELPNTHLKIMGHTDNVGEVGYNMTLSMNRALSVSNYIQKLGFPAENIEESGKGLTEPIADNSTELGRAQNRRVEISIIDANSNN